MAFRCGCLRYQFEGTEYIAPLLQVAVQSFIYDYNAEVLVEQQYANPCLFWFSVFFVDEAFAHPLDGLTIMTMKCWILVDPAALLEAEYVFPLDDKSAVCSFEAVLQNGTIIRGVIKKKDEVGIRGCTNDWCVLVEC